MLFGEGKTSLFKGVLPHSRADLKCSCSTLTTPKYQITHRLLMAEKLLGWIMKKIIICIITGMKYYIFESGDRKHYLFKIFGHLSDTKILGKKKITDKKQKIKRYYHSS